MDQVRADLRRWYGVELRVTDSLLQRRVFTGSFTTEPADRVLDAIRLALGASVVRRGDTAYVSPAAIK
jgi:transmembrane sensor